MKGLGILETARIGTCRLGLVHLCRWNSVTGWTPLCHSPEIHASTAIRAGDEIVSCVVCVAREHVHDPYFDGAPYDAWKGL